MKVLDDNMQINTAYINTGTTGKLMNIYLEWKKFNQKVKQTENVKLSPSSSSVVTFFILYYIYSWGVKEILTDTGYSQRFRRIIKFKVKMV